MITSSHSPSAAGRRRPSLTRSRALAAALTLAGATLAGPALAAPAHATLPDLVCDINFQLNMLTPLTLTNHTSAVDATAGFVDCISPNGTFPNLWSAAVHAKGTAVALPGIPCSVVVNIDSPTSGPNRFEWSPTGQVSKFTWQVNTNPLAGTITLSAHITSGPMSGDTVTAVPIVANPNPDCLINGLKYLSAPQAALTFG